MHNDKSLLNKVLQDYNSKYKLSSSSTRFLTSCEVLNEYMNDPCSIFNENIVPIGPMPPIPPMSPVPIPPMPPVPPGKVIIGSGRFIGLPAIGRAQIRFMGETKGIGIAHSGNNGFVELIANTMYEYSYTVTITTTNIVIPNMVESHLFLFDNVGVGLDTIVPRSEDQQIDVNGTIVLQGSGMFNTNGFNTPDVLLETDSSIAGLEFVANNATLLLDAIG